MEELTPVKEDLQSLRTSLGELSIGASLVPSARPNQSEPHDDGYDDFSHDDGVWNDASGDESNDTLSREWSLRQNQFHTMGYREGITEGKKASAQEGFNVGFKQSVEVGHKWGLIRGITSALASLSDSSREALVPSLENRRELQNLYESVEAISSDDALKMYHQCILRDNSMQLLDHSEQKFEETSTMNRDLDFNELDGLCKDLTILLHESQKLKATSTGDES